MNVIWIITKKEFFEKILDFRVTVSFVIAIALTVISTLVVGADYQFKKAEYDRIVAKAQSELSEVKVFSQYEPKVFYSPSPLSVFSKGIDVPTPISETININWVPHYRGGVSEEANPLMQVYNALDLVTVIRILFSLLIVLLTFDTFSGEKEQGTIKQMLSNPLSRINVLFGKFIGTLMIVGTVVILTFIITLIVLGFSSDIVLTAEEYLRVLLMAIATFIYLSIFVAIGIFVSIKLHHSSTSLTVMLVIWIFVCILQPNLNTYIANKLTKLTTSKDTQATPIDVEAEYARKLEMLQEQNRKLLDDSTKKRYPEGSIDLGGLQIYTPLADADYDILKYTMDQISIYREAAEYAEKSYDRYNSSIINRLERPLYWKRVLEFISPAAFFTHSIAILSRTDYDNVLDVYEQMRRYRKQFIAYLDQKGVFSTNSHFYFTRLSKEQIDREATEFRILQYEKDSASVPWTRFQSPLNVSDAPVFGAQQSGLLADVENSAEKMISAPLFLVILFFWTAQNLRYYDPR